MSRKEREQASTDKQIMSEIILEAMCKRYTTVEQKDLYMLVQFAFIHQEITTGKAAELLGIPLEAFRAISQSWLKEPEKHDIILHEHHSEDCDCGGMSGDR